MEYAITRAVLAAPEEIPATEQEWNALGDARSVLEVGLDLEIKFDLLKENYYEFESHLLDLALRQLLFEAEFRADPLSHSRQSNRHLANLLTTARLYVDQSKNDLCRVFGNDSNEFYRLVGAFSKRYDDDVGYRAMEALRNFVQHCALAVSSVSHSLTNELDTPEEYLSVRYIPYLHVRDIERPAKFKASVRDELKERADKKGHVNLIPLVREYLEGLSRVHEVVREMMKPRLAESDSLLDSLLQRWTTQFGASETGVALIRRENGEETGELPLFRGLTERRVALEKKNSRPVVLRGYVSNRLTA